MKLSIAVVTMNRSRQLVEALESCLACELPSDTQFVIIDNASTDDTESVIKDFFHVHSFTYYYEKMNENIGCGRGRNYAYSKCLGEYSYFLDDDAYISEDNPQFFIKAIEILDKNEKIGTLTTQIYDLMLQRTRIDGNGPVLEGDIRKCYMFCGGSHFLCKRFFGDSQPYFPNQYGYEEILPSLRVADAGYFNAYISDLVVIHNPLKNKWNFNEDTNAHILINELICLRVMKESLYPILFVPVVYIAYLFRSTKYLNKSRKRKARELSCQMRNQYAFGDRIKIVTILDLFRDFGISIF